MRYLLTILIFGLISCYTPRKAERQIDKAFDNYPEIVANKAAKVFPVKADSIAYTEWKYSIDSVISTISDTITEHCPDVKKQVTIIREKLLKPSPVYIVDSAVIYRYQSLISKADQDRDKYKKRSEIYFKAGALIIIGLLLFCIAYLLKDKLTNIFKRK
jgi:hypothetical protein